MEKTSELLNKVVTPHLPLTTDSAMLGQQSVQTAPSNEAYAANALNSIWLHHIQEPLFNYYIELNTHEGCNTLLKIMQLNHWYLFAVGDFISSPVIEQYSSSPEIVFKWNQVLKNNNADLLLDCFRSPTQQTLIQYFHAKRNLNIPFFVFANVFESHLELLKSLVLADILNLNKLPHIEGKFAIISLDKYAKVLRLNFSSPCSSYVLAHVLKDTIVSLTNHRRLLYSLPSHLDDNLNRVSQVNLILISFLKENKFFDFGSDILHSYLDYLWLNLLSIINNPLNTEAENNQKNQNNHVFAFDGFVNPIKNEVIDQSNFELVEFVEYAIKGIIYDCDDEELLRHGFEFLIVNLLSIINNPLNTEEDNNQKKPSNHEFAFDGFVNLIKNEVIDQSNFELVEFVEYAIEGLIYDCDDEELLRHGFEFLIVKFPELRSPITKKMIQTLGANIESNLFVGALCTVFDHLLEKSLIDQALATELQLVKKVIRILSRNGIQICDSEEQMRALWVLDNLAEKDFFDKSLVDSDFVQTVTSMDFFSNENYQFVQELFFCLIEKSLITKFELATYIDQCFYCSSWRVKANVLWLFSGEEEKSFMDKYILNKSALLPKFLESLADYHSNFESKKQRSQGFLAQAIQFINSIVDNDWIDQSSVVNLQLVEKLLALLSSDAAGPAFVWLTKLLDKDLIDKSWIVTKPELVKKIATHLVTRGYPYLANKSVSPKGVLAFAEIVRECFKRSEDL